MGKCIYKVDDNGKERFIVWSSVVDGPVTFALTAEEIEAYLVEEAVERAKRDVREMLERTRRTGTSSYDGGSLADEGGANRAGPDETCLSADELFEFYVRRKEDPTKMTLAAYRKGRR